MPLRRKKSPSPKKKAPSPKRNSRYGIVASRFNGEITRSLVRGALSFFGQRGIHKAQVPLMWVPGAFELPVAALRLAKSGKVNAVVAVGCILEGETPHWSYLSQATLQGLTFASVFSGIPVTCGVITARHWKDAVNRAQEKGVNRGWEAAEAAWNLVQELKRSDSR